jgi:hypothetical protein
MGITPDTKNWTWVLVRACPECGFDTTSVSGKEVPRLLRQNAPVWLGLLRDGTAIRTRPRDDRWSTLEYACHVRDVFRIFDLRLALMLGENEPTFPDWDQDAAADADDYGSQDPVVVAMELQEAALKLANRIDGVGAVSWSRVGTRSDGARFTIETLTRYLIHDPVHHLYDVGAAVRG